MHLKVWDVTDDQGAVDLIRNINDAQEASRTLVKHALKQESTDNITVMVIRFLNPARSEIGSGSSMATIILDSPTG